MSQAEDLLNSLTTDGEVEEHIVIGNDRFITVPQSLKKIAVQFDNNVRTVTFDCPRYSDGRDLSAMIISINYMRPDGDPGLCQVEAVTIDENDDTLIHFDWGIKDHVTEVNGTLSFLVCAKKTNSDGTNENHWNSELNQEMTISKGLNCNTIIIEKNPDLITQILVRLDDVETREVTQDDIKNALGYVPPEYDKILYEKYEGTFINIQNTSDGTAHLIDIPNELVGHRVTCCGKNLFNINGDVNVNLSTGEDRPGYVVVENGVLTANLNTSSYHPNGQRLYNLKGKTITFSATCISEDVDGYIGIYENGSEEEHVAGKGLLKIESYVCKSDNPIFGFNTSGTDTGAKFINIQIEIGESVTDYEAYVSERATISSDTDNHSISTYNGQTNIFNDCNSDMTVIISPILNELQYSNSLSVKRREFVISDANKHTTTCYAKSYKNWTTNLPDKVYGTNSECGVIFFIAENTVEETGTQFFYPIDGPYKGRIFTRSLTHMTYDPPEPGEWTLLANEAEVNAAKEEANAYTDQNVGALLRYVQSIIRPYELTWIDGYYISKDDGSVQSEEGSSCCDFAYVTPGSKLIVSNTMTTDTEYNVFYDSSKNYISSFSTDNGSVVTAPENARYFRLSKHVPDSVIVLPEVFINTPKASTIELPIDGWTGSNLLYQQTVSVPIVTENSQVDLRPSPAQLQELLTSEISLTVANESGLVTVFAIGGKPISDYTMQIIVSEVISV